MNKCVFIGHTRVSMYMTGCVSVCRHPPHVTVHLWLVPVTVVSHHMVFLSGIPWLLDIMYDVHGVFSPPPPPLSSWKQAGLSSFP